MTQDGKTYYQCKDCGWVGALAYTKRHTCPDCRADDMQKVQILMIHDETRKAYIGYFADEDGHQISPMKAGPTKEEVLRRLQDMGGY